MAARHRQHCPVRRAGAGCASTAGTLQLSGDRELPWLAARFGLRLRGLVPGNPAALLLGSSSTSWHGLSLPLALGFAGMPGCTLLVGPDAMLPLSDASNEALALLTVPENRFLIGSALQFQGLGLDAAANPAGVVLSNAVEARIGQR